MLVTQNVGKLAGLKPAPPDGPEVGGHAPQLVADGPVGTQNYYRTVEPLPDNPDRLRQVRVVGDHDGHIEPAIEGIQRR